MEAKREANEPKVTQLLPEEKTYRLPLGHRAPRSGLFPLLSWKHRRVLTLIMHLQQNIPQRLPGTCDYTGGQWGREGEEVEFKVFLGR